MPESDFLLSHHNTYVQGAAKRLKEEGREITRVNALLMLKEQQEIMMRAMREASDSSRAKTSHQGILRDLGEAVGTVKAEFLLDHSDRVISKAAGDVFKEMKKMKDFRGFTFQRVIAKLEKMKAPEPKSRQTTGLEAVLVEKAISDLKTYQESLGK